VHFPKKRGKTAGSEPQEHQIERLEVDLLYEEARRDGTWPKMFEAIDKGEPEKDARLGSALKDLRDNPDSMRVERITIVRDMKDRNMISIQDGFHRIVAAKLLGWKEIIAEVLPGDVGSDCPKCGRRVRPEIKTDRTTCPSCGATISDLKIRVVRPKIGTVFKPKSRKSEAP